MKINELTSLSERVAAHSEWLLIRDFGKSFPLKSSEIDFEVCGHKNLFGFISDSGFESWRIVHFALEGGGIVLDLIRNFDTEQETVRLIPRTGPEDLSAYIELARSEQANKMARLIVSETAGSRLVRVGLNKENGRFAQIIIESEGRRIAVLADVTESLAPETLVSFAILWIAKLGRQKKGAIDRIWVLGNKGIAANLQRIHACLSRKTKKRITILEIKGKKSKQRLKKRAPIPITGLWRFNPQKLPVKPNPGLSSISREILKLAPGRIDCIFSKNGETLRYLGLAFVRVRKIVAKEKAWFGISGEWKVLDADSREEFYEMIRHLKTYRRHDSPNLQHLYFHSAPEAWLESILRGNIKLLDQNLILSPIYSQFRALQDKIDLLALRRDGRLVVVELKVAPDREMILQAVDYWLKIELQRRKGMLDSANLFGHRKIADKPAIVYLAAPTLSYHRDFDFLSNAISKRIDIYRFDLGENWRMNVKVLGQRRMK